MPNTLANLVRPKGDPQIIESGPSSVYPEDRLAKFLGWFSIGLGLTEVFAAHRVTRALGVDGSENLVRAFGAREILSGVATLSTEKKMGLWSRVAGDAIDLATLASALTPYNPKRANVKLALGAVAAVTVMDIVAARAVSMRARRSQPARQFSDRSGFPRGLEAAKSVGERATSETSRSYAQA